MAIEEIEMNSKYTFWKLLNEYKIIIPIIQRDYVQGRTNENATEIRSELLDSIYNALVLEEPLNFDFVYGTVENERLLPLDGQQRLTTLFLLHWYLAQKEGKMDIAEPVLRRFSYATRPSSRSFCEMISGMRFSPEYAVSVSSIIKNENKYFSVWDKDPTISHMLVMLDAIHNKFCDCDALFDLLLKESNEALITFNYLPMEHYSLTDELYIKMNARGKILSDFENFKAKFIQHMKDKNLPYKHFESSIDNSWTDLLWEYRSINNTIDIPFMNLFCFITEMMYLEKEQPKEGDSPFKPSSIRKLIDYYDDEIKINELYSYLDLWKNKDEITDYFDSLLSSERVTGKVRLFEGKSDILSSVINGDNVSVANKVILFSVMKRCVALGKSSNIVKTQDFVRIIRNFTLNTRFFNKKRAAYTSDLRYGRNAGPLIDELVNAIVDAVDPYETFINSEFSFINSEICANEKYKAELLINDARMKRIIQDMEDLDVFRSSLVNVMPYIVDSANEASAELLEKVFNSEYITEVIRGLLSVGNYGIYIGGSIWGDRYFYGNYKSLYSVLTYIDSNCSDVLCKYLKQLEEVEKEQVEDRINEIIEINLGSIDKKDWRYCLIKYPRTIKNDYTYISSDNLALVSNVSGDSIINRRPSGVNVQGYHVIPEYIEIREQTNAVEINDFLGYASEKDSTLVISNSNGISLTMKNTSMFVVNYPENKIDWIEQLVESINTQDLDIVQKGVNIVRAIRSGFIETSPIYEDLLKLDEVTYDINWNTDKEAILSQMLSVFNRIFEFTEYRAERNKTINEACINIYKGDSNNRIAHVWPKSGETVHFCVMKSLSISIHDIMDFPEGKPLKERMPNWIVYKQLGIEPVFEAFRMLTCKGS